ncbi:MAG TPA: GntR family transcriptional regulator [Pseudolysinimonas sp.]|nr:GntR family transcriptional regulator [Pseudolysinimonas sp.]
MPTESVDTAGLPPLGESTTRTDLVVEAIRAAILSGQFRPGQDLVERRLAEALGVSKTPVREAFIVLARSGLLTTSQNRGVTVRQLSPRDFRHVYEQRALLEPWAIASLERLDDTAYATASQAIREADAAAAAGDLVQRALAGRRFHREMYAQCENSLVVDSLDALQDLTSLAIVGVLWERWPVWQQESEEHQRILDAAHSGDTRTASELMRQHIETSIERLAMQEVTS